MGDQEDVGKVARGGGVLGELRPHLLDDLGERCVLGPVLGADLNGHLRHHLRVRGGQPQKVLGGCGDGPIPVEENEHNVHVQCVHLLVSLLLPLLWPLLASGRRAVFRQPIEQIKHKCVFVALQGRLGPCHSTEESEHPHHHHHHHQKGKGERPPPQSKGPWTRDDHDRLALSRGQMNQRKQQRACHVSTCHSPPDMYPHSYANAK